jgi:hypothetical protein
METTTLRAEGSVSHFRWDEASRTASLTLASTRLLTSSGGGQFIGSSKAWMPAFRAVVGNGLGESRPRIPARLDPEAIRLSGDTMWIADEYAPALDLFTRKGRHIRREPLPARYVCSHASGTAEGELPPANTTGRQPNRGFESLTLSPDGSRAYLMTQSPLIQDGGLDADNKRIGINMRLLQVPLNSASPTREYLYLLDRPSHGVNELLADGESHILVLERDGGKGASAAFRAVYRVELRSDLDIAHLNRLPSLGLPPGVAPLKKGDVPRPSGPSLRPGWRGDAREDRGPVLGPRAFRWPPHPACQQRQRPHAGRTHHLLGVRDC